MLKKNSKRHLHFVLGILLVMSMIVSTAFVAAPRAQATDRTFTVGFDAEFPPYGYKDTNGEYVGFDLDLAQEVCDRNGWTLKKQPIDWDFKDKELNSGSIDCIWNGFTIDGRENDYTWSVPYVDNSQVVVVKNGSDIKKLSDLKDKIVVVQTDSSALAAFTGDDATEENKALANSFKELQQVGDYNSAFLNLESGMVDAVCLDIGVANYQISSRGDKFVMLEEKVASEKYGIGFKKGNTELKDEVEKTLFSMVSDGRFEEIAKKWGLENSICLKAEETFEKEDRIFTVGFDAEFPPYGYKDTNGEYVGFDLDLAQEVCERRGWTLKKQPIDWDFKDKELNSGSIDCIWNGFTIDGRENDYTWSVPYVDNSQVVVVKNGSDIKKLSDLKDKIVVVQTDSSALAVFTGDDATDENKALANSFKELQQVGDYNSAFLNLESGMVDAVCLDIGVANYQISSRGNKFVMLEERVASEKYGIGFKKGNTELKDKVEETLLSMVKDGKFEEIAKKWGLESSICLKADEEKTERNTLIVGFDEEFPPYGYKDENGEYVGFDIDLAKEVCKRNGWTLQLQPIDWNKKDDPLNSGEIDCIWNGFTINGRENDYTWSVPYTDNSQVIVVKKNSKIKELSDLEGKAVTAQANSSALTVFTGDDASEKNKALAASFKELKQVSDYNSAFASLEDGSADAVCIDIIAAEFLIVAKGSDKFAMLEEKVSSEQCGIGFKKGNTELRDTIQNTLFKMKREGVFEEIAAKWGMERVICLNESDASSETSPYTKEKLNFGQILMQLMEGVGATLLIFALTLIFSMPLGLLLTFIRMSKLKVIQWLAKIYISIMRGTPLMLQLIVVFYAPYYIFNVSLGQDYRFYAVIIGFSLNYAAYFAEIFRAGIQAVPNGQREAAAVLGYSKSQTFGKIIFPQMVKHIIPPVTNEIITLVKDTSLAFVLTYVEMFTIAKQIAAAQASILPLFAAGLFYYVFNMLVAFLMGKLEKRLDYYR